MAQVLEFRLPDLGEGLTEASIVRWLVAVGEVVAVDQPVVEVETAKALVEVPCPYGGVVTARFGEEGAELPVGAPLLTVAVGPAASPAGQDPGSGNVLVGYGTTQAPARRRRVRPPTAPAHGAPGTGTDAESATGAQAAGFDEVAGTGVTGTGVGGTGVAAAGADGAGAAAAMSAAGAAGAAGPGAEVALGNGAARAGAGAAGGNGVSRTGAGVGASGGDGVAGGAAGVSGGVRAPAWALVHQAVPPAVSPSTGPDGPVRVVSPLVRRLARDNGVDLRQLSGSGPDGLILRADVEDVLRANAARAARAPRPPLPAPASPEGTRVPLKGVRGAVAAKLARSRTEIPDATCWVDADATELLRARTAMNAVPGAAPGISLLALLARVCTAALTRFPELNSTVDTAAGEIVRLDHVHLGFAAQTERGLVVPVVRDAHARNAEGLTAELARLTEAARAGTLTPRELTGGTFTLNNYGVFGVDGSTPIINHPEAAMLGVGRIAPKPWVHEGELAVRQVVQLSLTFDHRVCDGGTAGGFLRHVADCVEQPAVLLRTL
ncbi:dihydrolipoamide acetyltransferase family protein [Streptomyces sp. NPDC047000]|uniref:dihydrolipoamide acetyltransferase family protein n=1 Tax=Streptomyces sp. NPDC047000 TaxID=3155474 RepID=UPI0033FE8DEF